MLDTQAHEDRQGEIAEEAARSARTRGNGISAAELRDLYHEAHSQARRIRYFLPTAEGIVRLWGRLPDRPTAHGLRVALRGRPGTEHPEAA
jgi:hypothetical protein